MNYFKITNCKGFYWGFSNGWGLSVQWGRGNYADNYDLPYEIDADKYLSSSKAEIAIITPDDELFAHPDFEGDMVKGYCTPEEVFTYLEYARNQ